jgi:hypothetical protein
MIKLIMSDNEKIIFLHIPKTAGTSLRLIIEQEYQPEDCLFLYYPVYDEITIAEIQLQLSKAKVLYGHLTFGVHELFNITGKYITFLRHPIDRVISFYKYSASDLDSPYYAHIQNGLSLVEMLQQEITIQTNNHMTRILANYWQEDRLDDSQYVDKALENLNNFYYVGLLEKFNESIEQLGNKLNWKTRYEVPFVNANTYEKQLKIDSTTQAVLEQYNHLDLLLYEAIKSKYY